MKQLTDVPGVGARMAEYLRAGGFSSPESIVEASTADLVAVPRIGPATARAMKDAAAALISGASKKVDAKRGGGKRKKGKKEKKRKKGKGKKSGSGKKEKGKKPSKGKKGKKGKKGRNKGKKR